MINRLLFWVSSMLRTRLIKLKDQPYLERYYLGTLFGITFYLHRFVDCDGDRELHNHPFNALSIVLTGWYTENRLLDVAPAYAGLGTLYRLISFCNVIRANTFHQITYVEPGTWSLFMHGPRITVDTPQGEVLKGWGFLDSYLQANGDVLIAYRPYVKSTDRLDWWNAEDCPIGKNSGRVPLDSAPLNSHFEGVDRDLINLDYAQIETRVAASLLSGEHPHTVTGRAGYEQR